MTVAAALTVLLSRLTLDDAYITFRYARHLAEGYGLGAWNHTGERVEGYSSLLWTLLLGRRRSARRRCSAGVEGVGRCGGARASLPRSSGAATIAPPSLPASSSRCIVPFVLYAASGMEAVAFTSLVTLALVGPAAWQPIVAPLLVAMRPEGVLVAGIDVLALAWRRERRRWIVATATCRRSDACGDRDSPLGDVSRARAEHLLREGRGRRPWTREARPRVRRRLDARARAWWSPFWRLVPSP